MPRATGTSCPLRLSRARTGTSVETYERRSRRFRWESEPAVTLDPRGAGQRPQLLPSAERGGGEIGFLGSGPPPPLPWGFAAGTPLSATLIRPLADPSCEQCGISNQRHFSPGRFESTV